MRLVNTRYYAGASMFWDKRAATLEDQTTQPIQHAVEMGFDAAHGGIDSLIRKLQVLPYYPELFKMVFGSPDITEDRIQLALAQFIRSIESFESRFDEGFAQVFNPALPNANVGTDFPNYTAEENLGKTLFLTPPVAGGAGCAGCHSIPTFSLDVASRSNGLDAGETIIFKAPSLKNVGLESHFMHDGRLTSLEALRQWCAGWAGPRQPTQGTRWCAATTEPHRCRKSSPQGLSPYPQRCGAYYYCCLQRSVFTLIDVGIVYLLQAAGCSVQ
jgi:cytochrome c peroxidase